MHKSSLYTKTYYFQRWLVLLFLTVVNAKSRTHSSVQRVPKFTIASLSSSLWIGKIVRKSIDLKFEILKSKWPLTAAPWAKSRFIFIHWWFCHLHWQFFDLFIVAYLLILPSLLWSNTLKAALTSSFKSQLPLKSQSQDLNHLIFLLSSS